MAAYRILAHRGYSLFLSVSVCRIQWLWRPSARRLAGVLSAWNRDLIWRVFSVEMAGVALSILKYDDIDDINDGIVVMISAVFLLFISMSAFQYSGSLY